MFFVVVAKTKQNKTKNNNKQLGWDGGGAGRATLYLKTNTQFTSSLKLTNCRKFEGSRASLSVKRSLKFFSKPPDIHPKLD